MKVFAVDTETTGNIKKTSVYDPSIRMSHISWWHKDTGDVYCKKKHSDKIAAFTTKILENPNVVKVFWNSKFDVPVLLKEGINLQGPILDAMIMAQITYRDEIKYSLKEFSRKYLNYLYVEETKLKTYIKKHKCAYSDVPFSIVGPYCLADSKITYILFQMFLRKVKELNLKDTFELEMDILPIITKMEAFGASIDVPHLDRIITVANREAAGFRKTLQEITEDKKFNPNSPRQVAAKIFENDDPISYTKTGQPSTDESTLLQLNTELTCKLLEYKEYAKVKSTYGESIKNRIDANGLVHANFNQGTAKTGRFACTKPPLQTIPRDDDNRLLISSVKEAFVTRFPDGYLVSLDYNQLQLRILAHISQEPKLINAFNEGRDPFADLALELFKKAPDDPEFKIYRYLSKTYYYALMFGAQTIKIRETIIKRTRGKLDPTLYEVAENIEAFWSIYPRVYKLFETTQEEVLNTGGIRTLYGRWTPLIYSKAYAGVNYKVQGTEADFFKIQLRATSPLLDGCEGGLALVVHDDQTLDLPKRELHIANKYKTAMEDHTSFVVPITTSMSYGKNWRDQTTCEYLPEELWTN